MPTISVLMGVYNGEEHLAAAVRSILDQTFADFELLVVDDGSTDDSPAILAEFEAVDRRVRVLRNDRNMGLVAALNRGLREAAAPFVARMDADDISDRTRLERQQAFLMERPEVDVVGSWLRVLGRQTVWERPTGHDEMHALLCFETCFYHPTVMFRREPEGRSGLRDAIAYDPSQPHAEDYGLWVRLALDHGARFANVAEPLVHYRMHPASVSRMHRTVQLRTTEAIRRAQVERLGLTVTDDVAETHFLVSTQRLGPEQDFLERAGEWIARLKQANDERKVYSPAAFTQRLEILSAGLRARHAARWAAPSALAAE